MGFVRSLSLVTFVLYTSYASPYIKLWTNFPSLNYPSKPTWDSSTQLHEIVTPVMAITILPTAPAVIDSYESSSEDERYDLEGDMEMADEGRPSKRARTRGRDMVTPGEMVTDDPQWMR